MRERYGANERAQTQIPLAQRASPGRSPSTIRTTLQALISTYAAEFLAPTRTTITTPTEELRR
jgi:hypothetical protein